MAGERQGDDPLFRPEAVAEQQDRWLGSVVMTPAASLTIMTAVIAIVVGGVLALLVFGDYTRKARLSGWLAPEGGLIQIVAPQAGVLTLVTAQEGLEVAAGAPLAVVSAERRSEALGATQGEVLRALNARRDSLVAERERHRALFGRQAEARQARLAVMAAEIAELEEEFGLLRDAVALAETQLARQRDLRQRDLVTETTMRDAEADVIEKRLALQSLERQRTTLERSRLELAGEGDEAPLRQELQLAEIDRAVAQIEQELAEAEAQREMVVTAPQAGTLTALHAAIGDSVASADPLMILVPAGSKLEARLYGPSRSIGFVGPGQEVILRYDAYPHQKFGHYRGVVTSVSRAPVSAAELAGVGGVAGAGLAAGAEALYRVTVALDAQAATAYGAPAALQPGMTLQADVLIERRRIHEWVFDPFYALAGRSPA